MTLGLWELQLTNAWCYFFATISYTLTSLALLAVFLTMQNVLFRKQSHVNIARYYLFFVVVFILFYFFILGGGCFVVWFLYFYLFQLRASRQQRSSMQPFFLKKNVKKIYICMCYIY